MKKTRVIFAPKAGLLEKNREKQIPGFSIVIPSYMRPALLSQSLGAIINSRGINKKFKVNIYIVDATPPEHPNKGKIIRNVKEISRKSDIPIYLLQEIRGPSITNAKIEGANFCKNDRNAILVFVDTDICVRSDALLNTINKFRVNRYAAWVGRRSIWKGKGPKNNTLWKPEAMLEGRTRDGIKVERDKKGHIIKNKRGLRGKKRSIFISAIHGDYVCMYKEVYFNIGGYDVLFGNHGENVDLSVRCWRSGYPLVYDESIVVYHSIQAPYSILRKTKTSKKRRAMAIFSTPLKICYIYGTMNRPAEMIKFNRVVYEKWVKNVFKYAAKEKIPSRMIYYIAEYIDSLIDRAHLLRKSRKRAAMTPYREFMPYDIFKDLNMFKKCVADAPKKLENIRKKALLK